MGSARVFSQVPLVALGWLCVMLPWVWPSSCRPGGARPVPPLQALRKRSPDPNPFAGLTHQPHCAACEHTHAPSPHAPSAAPPASCPGRGADARATPRARSAPPRTVRIGAGWAGGISAPLGSPVAAPGGSGWAPPVAAIFSRPWTRSCMASARRPSAACASARAWPPGGVSGAQPGDSRSIPTRGGHGEWRPQSSARPFRPTSGTTDRSGRCNSLRGVRCAARSRTARAMRPRLLTGLSVRPLGSGGRWPRRGSGYCPGPWASAPWRWRHGWSTTSRRSWPPTVHRGC